jgi:Sulfotransferase domain
MPVSLRPSVEQQTSLDRLANLVVIGVSKAGTTSLFEYLGRHPEIGLSDHKEVRYFTPVRYGEPLPPLDAYARHFRNCSNERYAVEATPGYFYGGRTLARAMHETCGSVRVVLSLREPGDRCWSWFRFMKSRMRIPKDLTFDDYLDHCEWLHSTGADATRENQAYWGLGGSCYSDWLDDWIDEFGDDLRLVFFDDLARDPGGVVNGLFDWLGLDPRQAATAWLETANKTELYRNRTVQRTAVAVNRRGERFFRRHPALKRGMRSIYYQVNRAASRQVMPDASRNRLDRFFQPYNRRLAAQVARLGVQLPEAWA